ncbi:unnamed protein product [Nippostrongylus brasiliensis]|uniref:Reverse transcriptase domain-containing protein n=1 Tax=Nippostrongylus brasiliensis TaxID=27835 RepID=A0A0N4YXS1_NIPBR|nr:unnamed protein product [Nippostrongylus brasiliensis]
MYADDIKIYKCIRGPDDTVDMQAAIQYIDQWSERCATHKKKTRVAESELADTIADSGASAGCEFDNFNFFLVQVQTSEIGEIDQQSNQGFERQRNRTT